MDIDPNRSSPLPPPPPPPPPVAAVHAGREPAAPAWSPIAQLFEAASINERAVQAEAQDAADSEAEDSENEAISPDMGWPDSIFCQPVDELLRCPVCASVLRDAVQCGAQHCFCRPCLLRALEAKPACPLCRAPLRPADVQPNRMVRAMVDRLQVVCANRSAGCTAVLTLGEWQSHAKSCEHRMVRCENRGCNVVLQKRLLASHMANCEFASMQCPECSTEFAVYDRDQHSCIRYLQSQLHNLTKRLAVKESELARLQSSHSELLRRLVSLEQQRESHMRPRYDPSTMNTGVVPVGRSMPPAAAAAAAAAAGELRAYPGADYRAPGLGHNYPSYLPYPSNSAALRPALNDIVVLSEAHGMFGDAADGPLLMGVAGWVIADDASDDLPIRVHVHSRGEWWYAVGALRVVARAGDRVTRETAIKGVPVVRGPDWKWEEQDGGAGSLGFITRSKGEWCDVTWLSGELDNAYRVGPRKFDLVVATMNGATL